MKIVNNTDLPYRIVGQMIDKVRSSSEQETIYDGKVDKLVLEFENIKYDVTINYFKSYVKWTIDVKERK